jgi:hypothetical protein
MEVMVCHRDGYCLARNNFRVYQNLDTGRILFFPHGMDQLFGSSDLPWQPHMAGLLARAVLETREGGQEYRASFASLFTNVFCLEALTKRVDDFLAKIQPLIPQSEFRPVRAEAELVKDRIRKRQLNLTSQLSQPDLAPIKFQNAVAQLDGWTKMDTPGSGTMERANSPDGIPALHIAARAEALASWHTTALLGRGHYRFEGRACVAAVKSLPYGSHQGAALRIAGLSARSEQLNGDSSWRLLQTEFQIDTEPSLVELICEFRASAGEAWFDTASLRLVQIR